MAWIQNISDTLLKGRQEVEEASTHQYDVVTVHIGDKDLASGSTDDDYCQIDLPGPKEKKSKGKSKPKKKASEDDAYDYVRGFGEIIKKKEDSSGYEIMGHGGKKVGKPKKRRKSKDDDYHYVRDFRGAIRGDKKCPVSVAAVPQEAADGNYIKLVTRDTEKDDDLPGPLTDQAAASSEKKKFKGKPKRQTAIEDDYENSDYNGTQKLGGAGGKASADKKCTVSIAPEVAGNYTKLVMATKEKEKDYDVPESFKASAEGGSSIDKIITATATNIKDPDYYENNDYHGEGDKLISPASVEEPSFYENNDYNDATKLKQDGSQKEGDKKKLKSKEKSKDDEYDYVRNFRVVVKKGPQEAADGNYTKLLTGTRDTEKDDDLPGPLKEGGKSKDKKKSKAKAMVRNDTVEDESDYVINDIESTPSGGKLKDSKLFKLLNNKTTGTSEDDAYDWGLGETQQGSAGNETGNHGSQKKALPGSMKMKSALKGKAKHMSEDDTYYEYMGDNGEIKK